MKKQFKRSLKYTKRYGPAIAGLSKQVSFLKGIVNAEKKYFPNTINYNVSNTGNIACLNDIAQGSDYFERNGNSILCKYITGKLSMEINASATSTVCRVIVFEDLSNQNQTPAVTDVLSTASPRALTNPLNTDRFNILVDKFFGLSPAIPNKCIKYYIPINKHIHFAGAGNASFEKNSIFILYISDEATNTPVLAGYLRTAYYDN